MFLHHPFTNAFGLDIGDLSIKLVLLSPRRDWRGRPYFVAQETRLLQLPPGAIANGEIQQPELVRKKLLILLGKDGARPAIKYPWVVSSLPEPKTFLKLLELNVPATELTAEEVIFQAKKHLPFDLEESYWDWQVVSPSEHQSEHCAVLFGAAPKNVTDTYTYLLESVGLQPLAWEIEAVALARSLLLNTSDYSSEARLILDLGATRSSLVIYDNNTLQFSVSSNFSGELLTTAIATALKIGLPEAEKLKITYGLGYYKARPNYLKVVTGIVDALLEDIKTTLAFYKEHYPAGNSVTRVVLGGGSSALINLDNAIARKLKIAAHLANPWKNLGLRNPPPLNATVSLRFASAIGLAMRAVRNPLQE